MTYDTREDAELDQHVMPTGGREHEATRRCWCEPRLERANVSGGRGLLDVARRIVARVVIHSYREVV